MKIDVLWRLVTILLLLLIPYRLTQIWNGFRFAALHVAAVSVAGGYVFIDPIIPFYQFGETQVTQFTVGLRTADIDLGDDFLYRLFAMRTCL